MINPELILMAAGMGSRYGGLKQLEGVGPHGERLLDYSLFDALRAGFSRVIFVIRRAFEEEFRKAVLPPIASRIETVCVCQDLDCLPAGFSAPAARTKPWGTGHAILCCRDAVRAPFAVLNADDFYGSDAFAKLAEFLRTVDPRAPSFAVVGYPLETTMSPNGSVSRGVCEVGADGRLRRVEEWTDIRRVGDVIEARRDGAVRVLDARTPVSMNLWGFTPALFPALEAHFLDFLRNHGDNPKAEFFIPSVIDAMIKERRADVRVLDTTARWMGLTYPEDRDAVCAGLREMIKAGDYPAPLWGD
jgi:NDP-sugar pyrophosphorylase family protein